MTRLLVRKIDGRWTYICSLHFNEPRQGLGHWTFDRAMNAAEVHWETRHSQMIGNVCPRCANGLPICADLRPDGIRWTHEQTCATYDWADDVCAKCEARMAEDGES